MLALLFAWKSYWTNRWVTVETPRRSRDVILSEMVNANGLLISLWWNDYTICREAYKNSFWLSRLWEVSLLVWCCFPTTCIRKIGTQWASSYHLLHFLNNLTNFIFIEINVENMVKSTRLLNIYVYVYTYIYIFIYIYNWHYFRVW